MSNVFSKQPDWDYIKEKYPNDYDAIREVWGKRWFCTDCSKIPEDLIKRFNTNCVVHETNYGLKVLGYYVSKDYKVSAGDKVDLSQLYLLELNTWHSDGPVYRITDKPVNVHSMDVDKIKAIIKENNAFKECPILY